MNSPVLIYETIVTTRAADGETHIVPLGIRYEGEHVVLAPFRPAASARASVVLPHWRGPVSATTRLRRSASASLPARRGRSIPLLLILAF